jgi:lathosterol oxidase
MQTMIYGGLMAFNDLFAHDGGYSMWWFRKYDHSDHYRHHLYYVVNYGDAAIDRFFGTAYDPVFVFLI